jgi:ubiquinone/menaquinone biosynthesis C-methylase UbiE
VDGRRSDGDLIEMKTTERFSNRVEKYIKYRPGYPPEVLDLFRTEMHLQTSSVVADIGAGTGISARIFLENGNSVYGVEPNQQMREGSVEFLKDFLKFKSVDGTSENTNLPDKSVDIVVAAQAFHWFKGEETRVEFRRILKDGGFIALIWNERQLDSTDFLREYEHFLNRFATDYNEVRHEHATAQVIGDFFHNKFSKAVFHNSQTFDYEGLKGRLESSSYTPTEENPRYEPMIKELKQLFTKHEKNGKIDILYDTKIYYGQL